MSKLWTSLRKVERALSGAPSYPLARILPGSSAATDRVRGSDSAGPDFADEAPHDAVPLAITEAHAQSFGRIIYQTAPTSLAADKFRLLRMKLTSLRTGDRPRTILVTSSLPEDGKTTITLNLATALAEQCAHRVLVVDADLYHGCIEQQLGLPRHPGLTECLQSRLTSLPIRLIEPLGWHLLSRGLLHSSNPANLLKDREISTLVQTLAGHFEWILLDAPPVLSVTDALSFLHAADGCLLVARGGRTPIQAVSAAISVLERQNILGLVLNGIDVRQQWSKYSADYRSSH